MGEGVGKGGSENWAEDTKLNSAHRGWLKNELNSSGEIFAYRRERSSHIEGGRKQGKDTTILIATYKKRTYMIFNIESNPTVGAVGDHLTRAIHRDQAINEIDVPQARL